MNTAEVPHAQCCWLHESQHLHMKSCWGVALGSAAITHHPPSAPPHPPTPTSPVSRCTAWMRLSPPAARTHACRLKQTFWVDKATKASACLPSHVPPPSPGALRG